ncbi:Purine nucleoside phosphorylase [Fasciola gigantica]|uniref:Purine nucleoside phosphorylase n=1 Tax=Fasciola gigantica TaxID=46835 RepID=A0A504YUS2_FASGI|nr:Purine nucleoside phosphorylase [Fasciola gigantica]
MSSNVKADYSTVSAIAEFIRTHTSIKPEVGIICGSGLGKLADSVKNPVVIKYEEIPNFPRVTVDGHQGNLVFGTIGTKNVVVMQGRFHMYEGYSRHEVALPIRLMKLLGVTTLLVSNAAGGLNANYKLGDLVIIKDHISFPGLSLNNVLVGANDADFGVRFIATSDAYSTDLRQLALSIAKEQNVADIVRQGVYVHVGGPNYESPAECKMLRMLGADVVGMSTVPEVLIARHCGLKVFAVSLVTNISILDEESKEKANHEEVLSTAAIRTITLQKIFEEMIKRI